MSKKRIHFLFLCIIFLLGVYSVIGYIDVNSKEKIKTYSYILVENKPKFVEVEESKRVEVAPISSKDTTNYITVAGVSRSLMKDEQANHYYLNHNLNGEYDGVGVPYVDYRYDFTGRKTIIYAHSLVKGGGPFQALQNYHNNDSFYEKNRYITVHYQNHDYTYEIFSVYISTADNERSEGLEYYYRDNFTNKEWENTLIKYKNNSEYHTNVEVTANDKILILQTCSMDPNYYKQYYRYNLLVMGKLISE